MDERTARSGHPWSVRPALLWTLLPTLVLVLIAPLIGDAQVPQTVTTSITPTTGTGDLGTIVTHDLGSHLFNITDGTRPDNGLNLFHSFGSFTVGSGDTANFLNNTGLPTTNILSRVTNAGDISYLYGTIKTTDFGNANLFLVNPSGIILGPTASLLVGGSVSFTTAQYIRMMDSNFSSANFYANPASDGLANSILAVAPVVDFGFLNPAAYGFLTAPDPTATITLHGSALSVSPGQSISLVGGKVVIEGAVLPDQTVQRAQLSAPNGRILFASTASPGEFDATTLFPGPNLESTSFISSGSISLEAGSSLNVSGARTVYIKGGQLALSVSVNDATLTTAEIPAEIPTPTDTIILNSGSQIVTSNLGTEPGLDVQITVGHLNLDGSTIFTGNQGDGVGGNLFLNVGMLSLMGGQIASETLGTGKGGQVSITATSLSLNEDSTILTSTNGIGRNGDITLSVQDASVSGRSSIVSEPNLTDPAGVAGGRITVQGLLGMGTEANSVTLAGFRTGIIARSFGSALLGDIELHAKTISVVDGAAIQAGSPFDTGTAGNIAIEADSVDVSRGGVISSQAFGASSGQVTIRANQLTLDGASIVTDTSSPTGGRGGNVELTVGSLSLANSAAINSSASGTGQAGNVNILANSSVMMINGSTISASTISSGNAGDISITTIGNPVSLSNGASITSSTSGAGNAGQVVIATPTLNMDNGLIATSTTSTGNAGNIKINSTGNVSLTNGSGVSSASIGTEPVINFDGTTEPPGQAGNVTITATGGFTSNGSTIATSAEANHGGDISITAQNILLSTSTHINANSKAPPVLLELVLDANGQPVPVLDANGQPVLGNAGNIAISSASNVIMQNSSVTTEASQASGGQVTINAADSGIVRMTNSEVITSVKGIEGQTSGGDISVDPQFVILQNSQVLAQANAGTGGNINIVSNVFLADPNSLVDASSKLGISGTVNINAPVQNVSGDLVILSQDFSSAAALLAQQCAARVADGTFSTFVVAAREGLPVEPGGFLPSPSFLTELGGLALSGQPPQFPHMAAAGLFSERDARPLQLAKLGSGCRR